MMETPTATIMTTKVRIDYQVVDLVSSERIAESLFYSAIYSLQLGQDQIHEVPHDILDAMFEE